MKVDYLNKAQILLIDQTEFNFKDFNSGAQWMNSFLKTEPQPHSFYWLYGILKYGISILFFMTWIYLSFQTSLFLLPFSILIFYFVEVHFLFLFPLLIDNIVYPIKTSIYHVYRIGIFNCLFTTLSIGVFMLTGLFNLKSPFKNWYIGCLAIIIWYKNEVRVRL